MKTVEALHQKYGDVFIPIERVAADYYGIDNETVAKNYAAKGKFPGLKPFRAGGSKSPWLVSIENLAEALDNQARMARIGV